MTTDDSKATTTDMPSAEYIGTTETTGDTTNVSDVTKPAGPSVDDGIAESAGSTAIASDVASGTSDAPAGAVGDDAVPDADAGVTGDATDDPAVAAPSDVAVTATGVSYTTNISKPIAGGTRSISEISDIVAKSGYSTLSDAEIEAWVAYKQELSLRDKTFQVTTAAIKDNFTQMATAQQKISDTALDAFNTLVETGPAFQSIPRVTSD